MKPGIIRPIAICIIRRGAEIFVAEGNDPSTGQLFYRPLGGAIEFGERSGDAIKRELLEEVGAEIVGLRYLDVIENIFTYDGQTGHEIVLVYEGQFNDPAMYDKEWVQAQEDDGRPFKAVWKGLVEFGEDKDRPLYPAGLMEIITIARSE